MKRNLKRIGIISLVALVISVGLVGCREEPVPVPEPARVEPPVPFVTIDSVRVDFPTDGALPARNIIITVNVSNFDIVPKLGETYVPGEGHLHYYLDVEIPTAPGQPAISEEGTYVAGTETTYIWENVSPGSHTLSVQLVNSDHTPLEPPVTDAIKVTVNVGACGIGTAKPAFPRK